MSDALNICTDGSSLSRPRRGGIGFRYVTIDEDGTEIVENFSPPGYKDATNNEMESMACIKALEELATHRTAQSISKIHIFTDSMYIRDNLNFAKYHWPRQKWLNKAGRPIENAELWKLLRKQLEKASRPVVFHWVQGHSKDKHNRAADKRAKESARGFLNPPLKSTVVRRRTIEKSIERGSVGMCGQVLRVRIITATWMSSQKLNKYKYEVPSEDSGYKGNVDLVFSTILLEAGHHYEVLVNDDHKNPRILEMVQELPRC